MSHIRAESITLYHKYENGSEEDMVTFSLVKNNRGQFARLNTRFHNEHPAEREVEPGPLSYKKGEIVNQELCWGNITTGNQGRPRFEITQALDNDGGLSTTIGNTTNDNTGRVSPLVLNVGEHKVYIALYDDGTYDLQIRHHGVSTGRRLLSNIVNLLKNLTV